MSICFYTILMMSAIGIIFPINVNPSESREDSPLYTAHDPIYIDGNANFTSANGVTDGTGTQSDPYIIEGWNISAFSANGIEINNTNAHLIIRNCYVHSGSLNQRFGIYFLNVQNGRVENTISYNNNRGIYLYSSSNNSILNNSASGSGTGIYLYSSSKNSIFNNSASSNYYGIYLSHSSNTSIFNNSASNNWYGILLSHSSNTSIFNNSDSNGGGIRLEFSSDNNISGNTISDNWAGIYLYSSSNNKIFNNSAFNNGDGISLLHSSSNTIFNNIANSNDDGICLLHSSHNNSVFNNIANSNSVKGIYVYYSTNNNVSNNIANSNRKDDGIQLYYVSNSVISNNIANSNYDSGISLIISSNNNIFNNSVSKNDYGIHMYSSSYNNLYNNSVNSNSCHGIWLTSLSNSNILSNNSVNSNNWNGIHMYSSNYNNVYNNNASSNNENGISLIYSRNINVFNNTANSNRDDGFFLGSSSFNSFISNNISCNSCSVEIYNSDCENNTFHHNNFINGAVVNVINNGVNAKWDDGYSEGNYWSNYTGLDDGSDGRIAGDGVGDTDIPHMGLDSYPLIEPVEQPYTPDTTPPVISSIIVSEIMDTSAIITWTTDELSDSRVNYSHNKDLSLNSTQYNSTMTSSHSITLTDLSPGTTHYFEVSSTDKYGNTATDTNNSHYYRFATLEDTTLPTITDVTAMPDPQEIYGYVNISANVSDNVNVDTVWANITDPDGNTMGNFTMNYDSVNDRYYKNQTYNIVGTYQFIIWANDTSNNWNFSSEQFTMQDTMPPATPTGLMVTDVPSDEGGALNITWDANTELDLDHYTLYSNKTGSWAVVAEIPAGIEYYVDTGLTDGTRYYYNISASDDVPNESPQSATASGVPADNLPPATPTGLALTSLYNGDLNVTWNLNTDDTRTYSIYSNKTGTWSLIANVTHPQSWYVDIGLTSGTTYYYRISAWDEVPLESLKSGVVHGISPSIGTISGTVKYKDGNPIEGATVTIYEGGTTTNTVTSTTSNSNGEYSVDVSSGTYDVRIEKSRYEIQWKKNVEVTADQTTTVDFTLPFTTDILRDYWWFIPLIIVIVMIIVVALVVKKKKPVEKAEEERESERKKVEKPEDDVKG